MSDQVPIIKQVPLTVAEQIIHTPNSQRHLTIRNLHLTNAGAVEAKVKVAITPTGVPFQASAALLWDFAIPGNDFIEFGEGLLVPPGSTLQAAAENDNSCVLFLSGFES